MLLEDSLTGKICLKNTEALERLVSAWGDTVFHTVIRRTVKFSDSTVAGEPITTYARRLRLVIDARLRMFLDVCDGVEHAHRQEPQASDD